MSRGGPAAGGASRAGGQDLGVLSLARGRAGRGGLLERGERSEGGDQGHQPGSVEGGQGPGQGQAAGKLSCGWEKVRGL